VDPVHSVAVALLTNGGDAPSAYTEIFGSLFPDLCGVTPPLRPAAPPRRRAAEPAIDGHKHAGVDERHGARLTITSTDEGLAARSESTGELAGVLLALDLELVPVREDLWATRADSTGLWTAMRFYQLADGGRYVHFGGRATPKRE
jgi:hypothetical protein